MSESSTLPLDDSELKEDESLVILGPPATVPATGSMAVGLEGLGGLADPCPSFTELGPGPVSCSQFRCVLVALNGAGFSPCLNFLGADMGPLCVMVR